MCVATRSQLPCQIPCPSADHVENLLFRDLCPRILNASPGKAEKNDFPQRLVACGIDAAAEILQSFKDWWTAAPLSMSACQLVIFSAVQRER